MRTPTVFDQDFMHELRTILTDKPDDSEATTAVYNLVGKHASLDEIFEYEQLTAWAIDHGFREQEEDRD